MREDRLKILKMLEEGKVDADEAARLLEALNGSEKPSGKAKWLRVRVYDKDESKPKVKVNLPLSLIKVLSRFGKLKMGMPAKVQERLKEKGIDFDGEDLKDVERLIEEASEEGRLTIADVVDDEDGEKVEIYIE
jgi:hypothetical protein